ncbi:MAG: hypothetical protein RLZZ71_1670 [Bacteroidota bacterium]|jgi:hypothetical protein
MAYRPIDFNIIQQEFESRFSNGQLFEGKNFNYIKLVQHGLSYAMTDAEDKLLKKKLFGPWWFFCLKSWINAKRNRHLKFVPEKSERILFLEGRRKMKLPSGEEISPITHLIREAVLSTEYSWWDTTGVFEKEADFSLQSLSNWFPATSEIQKEIYIELKGVLFKLKKSRTLNDIEFRYVESAFYVFFKSFRRWHSLLSVAVPKTIVGITHYHNEGCLAAAKLLGIKTIELQHGLISKHDLYYVYPAKYRNAVSKGIFPNEIWLFGNFWNRVLEKGSESEFMKPVVVGNYSADGQVLTREVEKENVVLLCAQKNLTEPYIQWIRFMRDTVLPKHPSWGLIVKLHPLESESKSYCNEANENIEVLPINASLIEQLRKAKIQVSIYSTTFFDSLGMNVLNYSLNEIGYSSDYANEMIELGLAEPLRIDEDVIEKFNNRSVVSDQLERADVYGSFQPRAMNFH